MRLNAAYRTNDPAGSWAQAEFDLSAVYNSDPGYLWVTMITVRFDNSLSGIIGSASTFFDDVRFTYGVSQGKTIQLKNTQYASTANGTLAISGSAEFWQANFANGIYRVTVKLGLLGWANATEGSSVGHLWWPDIMNQTFLTPGETFLTGGGGFTAANLGAYTAPFGTNVTYLNSTRPNAWNDFFYGNLELIGTTLIGAIPLYGTLLSAAYGEGKLLSQLLQELNAPTTSGLPSFVWPGATKQYTCYGYTACPSHPIPNGIDGVSFAQFYAYPTGGSIQLQDTVAFTDITSRDEPLNGNNVTLSVSWPGDTSGNQPPSTPTVSGPTVAYTGTGYAWSACSTDPEGDIVRYQFSWGDGTSYTFTDWSSSLYGYCGQAFHSYASAGTYSITVLTQDAAHLWSAQWSTPLYVSVTVKSGTGGSILSGTKVLMADGTQIPVQDIQAGMQIQTYDPYYRIFYDATVTNVLSKTVNNLYVIETSNGSPIRVDSAEFFWVQLSNGQQLWVQAASLQTGEMILRPTDGIWAPITSVSVSSGSFTVYDLVIQPTLQFGLMPVIANGYLDMKT